MVTTDCSSSRCSTSSLGLPLIHDGRSPADGVVSSISLDLRNSHSAGYAVVCPRSRCSPCSSRTGDRLLYPLATCLRIGQESFGERRTGMGRINLCATSSSLSGSSNNSIRVPSKHLLRAASAEDFWIHTSSRCGLGILSQHNYRRCSACGGREERWRDISSRTEAG